MDEVVAILPSLLQRRSNQTSLPVELTCKVIIDEPEDEVKLHSELEQEIRSMRIFHEISKVLYPHVFAEELRENKTGGCVCRIPRDSILRKAEIA